MHKRPRAGSRQRSSRGKRVEEATRPPADGRRGASPEQSPRAVQDAELRPVEADAPEREPRPGRDVLQAVFDAIADPLLVIRRDYGVVLANRAAQAMAGGVDPVARGLKCHQFSHHRKSPCNARGGPCPLMEVVAGKAPVTVIHKHRDAEGRVCFVEVSAAPIFDASGDVVEIVEWWRDVTGPKQSEERSRRLAAFASENPDPVMRVSKAGTLIYANRASQPLLRAWGCRTGRPLPRQLRERVCGVFGVGKRANLEVRCEDRTIALALVPVVRGGYVNLYGHDISKRRQAQRRLELSNRFLEMANRYADMEPLLAEFVTEVKDFTGCAAVGIRILDEDGGIPYQAYDGFSREFYDLENLLSVRTDRCMCINVARGDTDAGLPFYTQGGSFHINGTTRFLATVSEEEKGQTRNTCNRFGYESVALVPIRTGGQILGLIHVADPREDAISRETVHVMEKAAIQLGTAIRRVRAEAEIRRLNEQLEQRVAARTAELASANRELRAEIEQREKVQRALEQSEADLRQNAARLTNAQHIARMGFWDWNVLTSDLYWSDEIYRIFGLSPQEFGATYDAFLRRVHPDDRTLVQRRVDAALQEDAEYSLDHRILLPDGRVRHVHEQGEVSRDEAGTPIRMVGTVIDVTERKRLEQEVLSISTREQERIAQELHDRLGQELTGLSYLAKSLHHRLQAQGLAEAETAAALAEGLPQSLAKVRAVVKGLLPIEIGPDDLVPALETLAGNVQERSHVVCRLTGNRSARVHDQQTAIQLYRIVQEAVINAVKHGRAREIAIELWSHQNRITLQVRDDGVGIRPEAERASGSGLRIMGYRAGAIGGVLEVEPLPHGGTVVTCTLPQESRHDQ